MTGRSLAAGAALLACATALPAQQPHAERLHRFIERAHALSLAPGLSVAVVQADSIVLLRGYGFADVANRRPVTPSTVFYIASSTKSFTGLAAALLHERGAVDLDRPIARYLPGVAFHEGVDPSGITLRDLLTHTHGIGNDGPLAFRSAYSGAGTQQEMLALLAAHGPAPQGRTFEYGNIGYNVASLVMDGVLGESWKTVLEREVLGPLGMHATTGFVSRVPRERLALPYGAEAEGFRELPYGKADENMHAAGGLVTTAADLARWLEAQISRGVLDARRVLPEAAFTTSHRALPVTAPAYRAFRRTGYALGWYTGALDGDSLMHHFGGYAGFHAHISFMPERRIGVVVLANEANLGSALADLVSRYAYDLLRDRPDLDARFDAELERYAALARSARGRIAADRARRAARPQTPTRPWSAYAGTYHNPQYGRLVLREVPGGLEATMGPLRSGVEVFDAARDALRVELTGGGTVVTFDFDGGDRAVSATAAGMRFARVP